MTVHVCRTVGLQARSVLRADLIDTIDIDTYPEDPQALADEYGGDILEPDPRNGDDEDNG